jgi:hypothetical protein
MVMETSSRSVSASSSASSSSTVMITGSGRSPAQPKNPVNVNSTIAVRDQRMLPDIEVLNVCAAITDMSFLIEKSF